MKTHGAQIVKFSDAVVLGFHALLRLADQSGAAAQLQGIADDLEVSGAHLSKVMQRLRKVGLVEATRGPSGGYRLAKNPDEVSLEAIFVAIEGPIDVQTCLLGRSSCQDARCGLGKHIGRVSLELRNYLAETSLGDLVRGADEADGKKSALRAERKKR